MIDKLSDVLGKIAQDFARSRLEPMISNLSICLRAAAYKAIKSELDVVSDKLLYGSERHEWFSRRFVQYVQELGWSCTPEHKIAYGNIGGRADIYCVKDGERVLFELKFTSVTTRQNPFLPFYKRQLMYYMAIDAVNNGGVAPTGVLMLIGFDMNNWYTEVVDKIDVDAVLAELKNRAERFMHAIETGELPPREKGSHCKVCTFRRECLNSGLEL